MTENNAKLEYNSFMAADSGTLEMNKTIHIGENNYIKSEIER